MLISIPGVMDTARRSRAHAGLPGVFPVLSGGGVVSSWRAGHQWAPPVMITLFSEVSGVSLGISCAPERHRATTAMIHPAVLARVALPPTSNKINSGPLPCGRTACAMFSATAQRSSLCPAGGFSSDSGPMGACALQFSLRSSSVAVTTHSIEKNNSPVQGSLDCPIIHTFRTLNLDRTPNQLGTEILYLKSTGVQNYLLL